MIYVTGEVIHEHFHSTKISVRKITQTYVRNDSLSLRCLWGVKMMTLSPMLRPKAIKHPHGDVVICHSQQTLQEVNYPRWSTTTENLTTLYHTVYTKMLMSENLWLTPQMSYKRPLHTTHQTAKIFRKKIGEQIVAHVKYCQKNCCSCKKKL